MHKFLKYLFILFSFCTCSIASATVVPAYDTNSVKPIKIDRDAEPEIFSDKDYLKFFENKTASGPSESLLEWLLRKLFGNMNEENLNLIWSIIKIALGILLILGLIFVFVKSNGMRIFKGDSSKVSVFSDISEDIDSINIDEVIAEALRKGDYKMAFRYTFLKALQLLNNKGFIEWQAHKTNYEYFIEFKDSKEKSIFKDLYMGFEQVWYGDGSINKNVFENYQKEFTALKNKLGA